MFFVVHPPDPDCKKCHGTGTVSTYERRGPGLDSMSIGQCDCRAYENHAKIQERCEHEIVCKRCWFKR